MRKKDRTAVPTCDVLQALNDVRHVPGGVLIAGVELSHRVEDDQPCALGQGGQGLEAPCSSDVIIETHLASSDERMDVKVPVELLDIAGLRSFAAARAERTEHVVEHRASSSRDNVQRFFGHHVHHASGSAPLFGQGRGQEQAPEARKTQRDFECDLQREERLAQAAWRHNGAHGAHGQAIQDVVGRLQGARQELGDVEPWNRWRGSGLRRLGHAECSLQWIEELSEVTASAGRALPRFRWKSL